MSDGVTGHSSRRRTGRARRRAHAVAPARSGSRTVNSAPPSGARSSVTVPPCRRTACWTRARPSPRPRRARRACVDQPRWKTSSAASGSTPGPVSATRSSSSPSSARAVTVTRGGSAALCPACVRRRRPRCRSGCPGPSPGRGPAGRGGSSAVVDAAVRGEDQLDAALVRLRRLAQQQRGQHRLARPPPTTWSVSACASSSSAVANSTASSARPSSISETTVCSRLAASCACERSASVKPRYGVQLARTAPGVRCGRAG